MRKLIQISAFLFFVSALNAGQIFEDKTVDFYVVFATNVAAPTQAQLEARGVRTKQNQPILETKVLTPANTNYLEVSVSTTSLAERDFFATARAAGTISLYKRVRLIKYFDGRTGGDAVDLEVTVFGRRPRDIDISWAVRVSSP